MRRARACVSLALAPDVHPHITRDERKARPLARNDHRLKHLRRRGPPLIQVYRDLLRMLRKEVVLAENASWLFRAIP